MKYLTLLPVLVLVALSSTPASATQYTCPPGVVNDTHHQQNGDCTPVQPTALPTAAPTRAPTAAPTTTAAPITTAATSTPATSDTPVPVTPVPSFTPTNVPNHAPTSAPTNAPTAAPTATLETVSAPSRHSITAASYVAHSSTVALCHAEDSQKGMDTANGVQSVQVRNVQPDAVQEYLQTSGLDHLMVPGGDCGPTQ